MNFRCFMLRGIEKAENEFRQIAMSHNFKKVSIAN